MSQREHLSKWRFYEQGHLICLFSILSVLVPQEARKGNTYTTCRALSLQSCWKDASNGDHPRQQFVELLQTEAMKIIRHASVLIVKDGDFRVSRA